MPNNASDVDTQPIGYRAFTARAAHDARPELFIEVADFLIEPEAREWVEVARRCCLPPSDFCCCVIPIFPRLDEEAEVAC
jgi:hypothetical protein